MQFEVGCDFEEFKRYLERAERYRKEGELDRLEAFLRKGLFNLIVLRLDGEVVGDAIWHESNADEHRKGDPRGERIEKRCEGFLVEGEILLSYTRFG